MPYTTKNREQNVPDSLATAHWTEVTFTSKKISDLWPQIDKFMKKEKVRNCSFEDGDMDSDWNGFSGVPVYDNKEWSLMIMINYHRIGTNEKEYWF